MKKMIAVITAVMMLVCGCAAAFADQTILTGEEAMKAVLDYTGLKEEEVRFTRVHLERDDGRRIYEIEFIFSGIEYEFDVDALTGRILEMDTDRPDHDRDFCLDDLFDFD